MLAATEFAQIAERRGATADASGHRAGAEKMARAVTEHGWDGQWFRRACYYKRINPSAREHISDVHRCEPYVYAQMIAGPDAPTYGEAKNSWLTGTAAWNLVAITQWILGIRAEIDGLRVDPVLPASWAGFTATRRFRGATYQIGVRNPDRISGQVAFLEVDGQRIDGTLVPLAPPGTTVHVEAVVR